MHKSKIRVITLITLAILLLSIPSTISTVAPSPYAMTDYSDQSGTVDLVTGDMSLTIPVLTVPGRGGMSYPITLNYRAGIQTNQKASWVGLGWNLDVPKIGRSVNAIPDDYKAITGQNNLYWHDKQETALPYTESQVKTRYYKNLAGISTSPSANPIGMFMFGADVITTLASTTSLYDPVHYVEYSQRAMNIPSTPQVGNVNGFIHGFNNLAEDEDGPVQEANHPPNDMQDINFPDSFFMTTPIYSGALVYGTDFSTTNNRPLLHAAKSVGSPTQDPLTEDGYDNAIDIHYETYPNGELIKKFEITDISGNKYIFDENPTLEYVDASTIGATIGGRSDAVMFSKKTKKPTTENCDFGDNFNHFEMYQLKPYATEWGITKIESGNSDNKILFEYEDIGTVHQSNPDTRSSYNCMELADGTMKFTESITKYKLIKTIITDTHVAKFWDNEILGENDRKDSLGLPSSETPARSLRAISLYQNIGNPDDIDLDTPALKTVYFEYDPTYPLMAGVPDSESGFGRLTLSAVGNCGQGSARNCIDKSGVDLTPPTTFDYYTDAQLFRTWEMKKFDTWGYFYDAGSTYDHNPYGFNSEDKNHIWSLEEITWPTGGTTKWEYESDRFNRVNNLYAPEFSTMERIDNHFGGGIRVSEIENCDGLGDCFSTLYLYTDWTDNSNIHWSEGTGHSNPGVGGESSGVATFIPGAYHNEDTLEQMVPGSAYSSPRVVYSKTTVVPGFDSGQVGDARRPFGHTVHEFTTTKDEVGGEFVNAFKGEWNAPQRKIVPQGVDNGYRYGLGFPRSASQYQHFPDKGIIIGPAGHTLRLVLDTQWLCVVQEFEYVYKDITLPDDPGVGVPDACGTIDYWCGGRCTCAEYDISEDYIEVEFPQGFFTHHPPPEFTKVSGRITYDGSTIEHAAYVAWHPHPDDGPCAPPPTDPPWPSAGWDPRKCTKDNELVWCPTMFDISAHTSGEWWDQSNIQKSYIMPFYFDEYYKYAGQWGLGGSWHVGGPNENHNYPHNDLSCLDDNNDGTCDRMEDWSSLGISQGEKFSGSLDKNFRIGLAKNKYVYDANENLLASSTTTYAHEDTIKYPSWEASHILSIGDGSTHNPAASWVAVSRTESMQDGIVSSTEFDYVDTNGDYSFNGLPTKVITHDVVKPNGEPIDFAGGEEETDGAKIVTTTKYAYESKDDMEESHRWSQVLEKNLFYNPPDPDNLPSCIGSIYCTQASRTIWDDCEPGNLHFPSCQGNDEWFLPKRIEVGIDTSIIPDGTMETFLTTSKILDYDNFGHSLIVEDSLGNQVKTYYGAEKKCNNDAVGGDVFSDKHAYVTCTENSLGFKSKYAYDANWRINEIESQVADTGANTDYARSYYSYDNFGRLTSVKDDFVTPGTPGVDLINYYYNFGTEGTCGGLSKSNSDCLNYVGTRTRVNQFLESHSVAYADGLGRSIQTATKKSPTESVFTDTFYNEISAVDSLIEPYVRSTGFTSEGLPNFRSDSVNPITVTESTKNYYENSPLARVEKVYSLIPTNLHDENAACGNGNPCVSTTFQASPNNRYARVITDQLGLLSTSVFDKFGRIVETTNAMGGMGKIDYDELGRVKSVSQLKDMSTGNDFTDVQRYTYDARGRVITAWTPEKGETTFKYDDNNNVIEREENTDDAGIAGKVVGIEYDELNRPTISWVEGSGAARDGAPGPGDGQVISVNKYDSLTFDSNEDGVVDGSDWSCTNGLGKVCLSQNFIHNVNTFYKYDRRGRITHIMEEIATPHDNGVKSYGGVKVTMYGYNDDGSLDSVTTDVDGDSHRNSYLYNSLGQLYRIVINPDDPSPQYIQYNYNDDGTLDYVDYPNGLRQEYSYDDRNRVSGIEVFEAAVPSNKLFDEAYDAYDDANNLLEMTNQLSGSKAYFQYDDLNQLRTIQERGYYLNNHFVEEFDSDIVYSFDMVGNRKSRNTIDYTSGLEHDQIGRDTSLFADTISNYEYEDETNKLISNDKCLGTLADPAFVYDPQGNMISKRCEVNMLPNGDFESGGIEHWMDWHQCTDPGCPFTDISRVWDGSSYAMRIETYDSESAQTARAIPDVTGKWITVSLDVKLDPSETISSYDEFSIWLYGGDSSDPECHDLKTSDGTKSSTIDYTVDQNWNRISISVYVPKSCAQYSELYRLYFHPKAPTSDGRIVLVDNIQLELGSVSNPQFGDTSTTTYTYDENNMIEKVEVGRNDGVEETLEFRYDASGRRVLKLYKPEKTGPEQATLYWYGGESVPLLEEVVGDLPDLN